MIFQAIGEKSRRELVLEALRNADIGDIVTYGDLKESLKVSDRALVQSAMNEAKREFLKIDQRTVEAVRNVGYKIVSASDHLRLAKQHQGKARRQVTKSKDLVVHVDFNELTPAEAAVAQTMGNMLSQQADFMRRYDVRQRNLEKAMKAITVEVVDTKETQAAMKERLAEVERRLGIQKDAEIVDADVVE